MPLYVVILAGGGGTRLWPLSRPERPKPFLPLLGGLSLLRRTFERVTPELAPADAVFVVTDRRYGDLVRDELPELSPAQVVGEPVGRNTAAAIALVALAIERPPGDVMVVLPADAHVANEPEFRAVLAAAARVAGRPDRRLVTLGIRPDGPATGYGYVVAGEPQPESAGHAVYRVERFVEKPTRAAAEMLLRGPRPAFWNAGIFLWRRDAIVDALARHAPEVFEPLRATRLDRAEELEEAYRSLAPVARSVDYAVMEPAAAEGSVQVVPADVGWSDLGSWTALRDALLAEAQAETGQPVGSVGNGPRRDLGSTNTLVLAGDRLVVTIGLSDTIVVDTPDALLVCAADRAQDVRGIAEELQRSKERDS